GAGERPARAVAAIEYGKAQRTVAVEHHAQVRGRYLGRAAHPVLHDDVALALLATRLVEEAIDAAIADEVENVPRAVLHVIEQVVGRAALHPFELHGAFRQRAQRRLDAMAFGFGVEPRPVAARIGDHAEDAQRALDAEQVRALDVEE